MSRKRTALQQAQRRARAKVRSLKARGATAAEIGATPVLSWSEVQALSPAQRGGYYQKLKSFNQTRMHVLESGEIIKESVLLKIKRDAREINRRARAEMKRIDAIKIDSSAPGASNISTIAQRQKESRITDAGGKAHYIRGTVYGSLTSIQVSEEPGTRSAVKYRAEAMAHGLKWTFDQRRKKLRDSVVDMLLRIGDKDTADFIKTMSDDDFDVLTQRTIFMDALATAYAPSAGSKKRGITPKEAVRRLEESSATVNKDYTDYIDIVLSARE